MSKRHPNSLWTKHRRGRNGTMGEIGGAAWNRHVNEQQQSLDYVGRFGHQKVVKLPNRPAALYHRGAFIKFA